MKKLIARLNKEQIFHSVTAQGVEVLKQPAEMDAAGKEMLQKYYGLTDFTVPRQLKDPFEQDYEGLISKHTQLAKKSMQSKKK